MSKASAQNPPARPTHAATKVQFMNNLKTILVFFGVAVLVSACATHVTIMKHPETGDVIKCEAAAMGLIPMMLAKDHHDNCVEQLRKADYKPV
jgi:hypothetical protein